MQGGRRESERVAARVRALVGADPVEDGPGDVRPGDVRPGDADPLPGEATWWDRLGERLPVRVDPGRRPVLAIGVVVVLVAVVTGFWLMSARPRTMPVSAAAPTVPGASVVGPSSAGPASVSAPGSTSPPPEVVVDVAGRVRRPGLYRLPPGSRVDDALRAAGGPLRGVDLTSLNLAAKLVDGQQIAVGRTGAVAAPNTGAPAPGGGSAAAGPVNLNSATLDELQQLPGIGPALGQRILDWRTEHGSFASVDQLDDVSGIGTVTFARLKPLVTV